MAWYLGRGVINNVYNFWSEKNKVYKDLLDYAFNVCDEFVLVVRKDISISKTAETVLESLSAFMSEKKKNNLNDRERDIWVQNQQQYTILVLIMKQKILY